MARQSTGKLVVPEGEPPQSGPAEQPVQDPLFHEFASQWFDSQRHGVAPRSVEDYRWGLERHLLPFFKGHHLSQITIAEAVRFPQLGEVFWRAGPERTRTQIEGFLRRAAEVGTLDIADARGAAEQFIALLRGDIHLRQLLRLDKAAEAAELDAAAKSAVATFLRAFGTVKK